MDSYDIVSSLHDLIQSFSNILYSYLSTYVATFVCGTKLKINRFDDFLFYPFQCFLTNLVVLMHICIATSQNLMWSKLKLIKLLHDTYVAPLFAIVKVFLFEL